MAPGVGLEPTTHWLHVIRYFHSSMDYIITYGFTFRCEALPPQFLRSTPK